MQKSATQENENEVNGKQRSVFALTRGMTLSVTTVTEVPKTVITEQVRRTGTMPPPPADAIAGDLPMVIERPASATTASVAQ